MKTKQKKSFFELLKSINRRLLGINKKTVLITPVKKILTVRACSADIAECQQLCQTDCPANICGVLCPSNVQVAFVPNNLSEKLIQENKDNIGRAFFGGNSLDFKSSMLNLNGIESVVFGKAICGAEEHNCTYVSFKLGLTNLESIVKIYNFISQEDKKIFFTSGEEEKEYKELFKSINIKILLTKMEDFES